MKLRDMKPGMEVVCTFERTHDDQGRTGYARVGKIVVVENESSVAVNFGRGFDGHDGNGEKGPKTSQWFVHSDELFHKGW